nr:hypothetical protein [uncultured Cohaesibacter sp.]
MTHLRVRGLPPNDSGRLLVRLNSKYRAGIPRYGIALITNQANKKSVKALVLGHDKQTAIYMPYDIRDALCVEKDGFLEFTIQKVGWVGKICWLLTTLDPAVRIPAWLALLSICLGVLGVALSLFSLK